MPGPIPTTDIAISEIDAQLGSPYDATDFSLYNCYDFASTSSGLGSAGIAGNYHNLAMGVGPTGNFATQIWGVWNIFFPHSFPLPVGNWGNYFYDANVVLDWNISMSQAFKNLSVDLYLSDAYSNGSLSLVANITLGPGQSSSVVQDFDTGLAAYSNYHATGYWIYADISSVDAGNAYVSLPSEGGYYDTDGVGPDLGRSRRTSGMPWNIGGSGSPFSGIIFGGNTINQQIAWNKRTSFTITVTQ